MSLRPRPADLLSPYRAAIALVGDGSRTPELASWLGGLTAALAVWLIAGPGLARALWGSHLR